MIEPMLPGFPPMPTLVHRDGLTLSIEAAIDAFQMIRTEGETPLAEGRYLALLADGRIVVGYWEALPWREIVAIEIADSNLDLCPCCAEWPSPVKRFTGQDGKTRVSVPHCEWCDDERLSCLV